MDFIEYHQIFVPLHVNNNHSQLPIIDLYEHNGLKIFYKNIVIWNKISAYLSGFFYKCLLAVHPSINSMLCYDPLVMIKFIEIETKSISHLNILSWPNINLHLFYFIVLM